MEDRTTSGAVDEKRPASEQEDDVGNLSQHWPSQPSKMTQIGCGDASIQPGRTEEDVIDVPRIPEKPEQPVDDGPEYCVLPEGQKIFLMLTASFSSIISPISSSIYLPAVNELARDLNVSITQLNLTITMYLIFQGIAPSFAATLSESYGRRPAYIACFIIYLGATIGLALQNNYAALMILRCLQSSGSSGTIALGSATVSDLSTRAERGKYIGYATMGVTLGPALGPVIGGLLEHFCGWRWIFWFLVIVCAAFAVITTIVFRETCRSIVGNGSISPPRWNRSLIQVINEDIRHLPPLTPQPESLQERKGHPNPLRSIRILADGETCLIAFYGALLYAGYMSVLSVLTSQLHERFSFNAIQIGLCYLPLGIGSLTSRWTVGIILDRNFKRQAKKQSLEIKKNKQQDIANFDIEHSRIEVTAPMVASASLFTIAYGWTMESKAPLAATLVMLFFFGHLTTGAFSSLNTLMVDINRESPATATAASNLVRCLLGAGAVAIATPLITAIGIGWTSTLTAFIWIIFFPCLGAVWRYGYRWRFKKATKRQGTGADSSV